MIQNNYIFLHKIELESALFRPEASMPALSIATFSITALDTVMLSITNNPNMLSVANNPIMLSVMAPV
jgi:hypothetical protein